jgi:tRNA-2-methylthio-N6-dimethylallyladenosine synthase
LVCRDHNEILKEVENIVQKGFKEIWFLGQNVNDYHSPTNLTIDFAKLLEMANEIEGNFWIRFTSPHPKNFSDELIEVIAKSQKVTPYLNLPVQSGDDQILRKMNRNYTIKEYKNLVKKIRSAFKKYRKGLEKEVAISTDIIVSFPGETKKQFENTKKLMKEIKFDMAYIAKYSPRPQTLAFQLKDSLSQKEKEKREKILTNILKKTAQEKNEKFVGREIVVLAEKEKNGFLIGKSRHYKSVKFEGKKDLIGNFQKVKIIKALAWGLKAKKVGTCPPPIDITLPPLLKQFCI